MPRAQIDPAASNDLKVVRPLRYPPECSTSGLGSLRGPAGQGVSSMPKSFGVALRSRRGAISHRWRKPGTARNGDFSTSCEPERDQLAQTPELGRRCSDLAIDVENLLYDLDTGTANQDAEFEVWPGEACSCDVRATYVGD